MVTESGGRRWSRRKEAGWSLRKCAPRQADLARAMGHSEGYVSKLCNGKQASVAEKFFDLLTDLAQDVHTRPEPLLVHCHAVVARARQERRGHALRPLLSRALQRETLGQAKADVAQMAFASSWTKAERERMRSQCLDHAERLLEIVGLCDALSIEEEIERCTLKS